MKGPDSPKSYNRHVSTSVFVTDNHRAPPQCWIEALNSRESSVCPSCQLSSGCCIPKQEPRFPLGFVPVIVIYFLFVAIEGCFTHPLYLQVQFFVSPLQIHNHWVQEVDLGEPRTGPVRGAGMAPPPAQVQHCWMQPRNTGQINRGGKKCNQPRPGGRKGCHQSRWIQGSRKPEKEGG